MRANADAPAATPRWLVAGDINGFLGLVVDKLWILGFLSAARSGASGVAAPTAAGWRSSGS